MGLFGLESWCSRRSCVPCTVSVIADTTGHERISVSASKNSRGPRRSASMTHSALRTIFRTKTPFFECNSLSTAASLVSQEEHRGGALPLPSPEHSLGRILRLNADNGARSAPVTIGD